MSETSELRPQRLEIPSPHGEPHWIPPLNHGSGADHDVRSRAPAETFFAAPDDTLRPASLRHDRADNAGLRPLQPARDGEPGGRPHDGGDHEPSPARLGACGPDGRQAFRRLADLAGADAIPFVRPRLSGGTLFVE